MKHIEIKPIFMLEVGDLVSLSSKKDEIDKIEAVVPFKKSILIKASNGRSRFFSNIEKEIKTYKDLS